MNAINVAGRIRDVSFSSCFMITLLAASQSDGQPVGKTEITKWQYGKKAAVSLTYDDGSMNQFRYALPVMEGFRLPATFFIITGPVAGSVHPPRFIGRPVQDIISESGRSPASAENFFERASASLYLGYAGTLPYYNEADELYESGKADEAYKVMDTLYSKVRNHQLVPGKDTSMEMAQEKGLSWTDIQKDASKGYEFASHTVTHAHMAILDTANMGYELRESRDDILQHLGRRYTFSAEVPFGIEDKRVMKFGFPIYPALRNMMPDRYMKEINRGYKDQPGDETKEYVQWQRGPVSKTPFALMKGWVDTSLAHNNIWLVLVFHGVDDIGWEPLSHQMLTRYFQYIKTREKDLWIATFGTVARYMRERMNARVKADGNGHVIEVTHSLDPELYTEPLTLKTYVSPRWKEVLVKQKEKKQRVRPSKDGTGVYILYQVIPNAGPVILQGISRATGKEQGIINMVPVS